MNAGQTHDTLDLLVPSDMGDGIPRLSKVSVLVVNTESEDLQYANKPAEKPVNGYGAPEDSRRVAVFGVAVDQRIIDGTCVDGFYVVDGDEKKQVCKLPEVIKYCKSNQ